jgi:flagellar protein FliL
MSDAAEKPAEATPKKGKKTLIMVIAAVVLLGGGGGGAAWWFLGRGEPDEKALAAAAEEKRKAARMFVTLDPFVVNLADRDSERYAQIGVVLEVEGKDANQKVTDKMPAVRNEILLLISSKQAQELITREGKVQLASEIALAAARPLGWTPPPAKVEEEEEEPPPKSKVKVKDGDKAKGKQDKTKKDKPAPVPNPVAQVHFASFIVQ